MKVRGCIFHDGAKVEVARGNDAPVVVMDLPLEVVLSPVVGCFFRAMTCWRSFLRMDLVGEKSEC